MLVAIIEATCFLGVPLHEIESLSIGTTSAPFNIANNRNAGIIKWNVGMINLMFEAEAETALKQAKLLFRSCLSHRRHDEARRIRWTMRHAPRSIG